MGELGSATRALADASYLTERGALVLRRFRPPPFMIGLPASALRKYISVAVEFSTISLRLARTACADAVWRRN